MLDSLLNGQVKSVTLRTKDNSVDVLLKASDKNKYTVGYPTDYGEALVNKLRMEKAEGHIQDFDVKPARTSVLLSMIGWIVPVIIFIGCMISPPGLMDDVDASHGQLARNMLTTGDWVIPQLDDSSEGFA